jgi:hypothetical protein
MDSALRGPSLKLGAFSARTHLSVRTILRALTQIETFADLRQRRRVCHCLIQVIADGEQWAAPMDAFIDEVVRRSIRHTRLMLRQGSHNWPVARLALRKILADLETSAPDDPSLQRLRTFIASTDRAWLRENR